VSRFDSIVYSTCLACGCHVPRGQSYCGAHRPIRRSAKLRGSGGARERFRREALARAGNRCEAVVRGVRCDVTDPQQLEAHHVRAISAGGSNVAAANGVVLCKLHHAAIEAQRLSAA
jgi:hypothetical protein